MKTKRIHVQPHGNHTSIEGLLGKTVEAILPTRKGGVNIRFKGNAGREPFLEISEGVFENGAKKKFQIASGSGE
jgi:hypothetical protein